MERWRRYRHPKIYQNESRPAPARRRWRPAPRLIGVSLGGLVVLASLWFLFWSTFFQIAIVTVQGEATSAAVDSLENLAGRNLLLLREHVVFTDLLQIDPSLATVHLARGFPNELQVTVTRRHPALVWKTGETVWGIDREGVAFPPDPTTLHNVPVVIDQRGQAVEAGKPLLAASFVEFIDEVFRQLPEHLGGRIEKSEVGETTFHVRVVTEWGWVVILDTTRPLAGQLTNLDLILKEQREQIHEYVDLRLEGWAYLK